MDGSMDGTPRVRPDRIGRSSGFYDPVLYDGNVEGGPRVGPFYAASLAGPPGSVVEFGCGTGTLLLPLVERGWSALGVDRSRDMLDAFAAKLDGLGPDLPRPELSLGDLRDARPTRGFDVAVCANDLFAHLPDRAALLAGVRAAADHLRPGGRLLTDLPELDVPGLAALAGPGGDLLRDRGCHPIEAGHLQIWEQTRYRPETGTLTARFRYEVLGPDGDIRRSYVRSLAMHPWRVDEVVLALMAVGFRSVAVRDVSEAFGSSRLLVEARDRGP